MLKHYKHHYCWLRGNQNTFEKSFVIITLIHIEKSVIIILFFVFHFF